MKASQIDMSGLRMELAGHSAEIAKDLLGELNLGLSNNRQLRFGHKGSLAVSIFGPKAGSWYDFEYDVGGDLFGLIRREHGGNFQAAIEYAQRFIGING